MSDAPRVCDVAESLNRFRVPLSGIERTGRQGPYRYFGAQGVIDHVDDYLFDGEYVLVAEDGENLRSRKNPIAFLVSGRFWVNNHAHILKVDEAIASRRFLVHAINHADLGGAVTGAAQPKLTKANLERLPLPRLSKAEQDRVAGTLGAFDKLIAINERRIEVLEDLARSLYREWFIRFRFPGSEGHQGHSDAIGGLPNGWALGTVDEFLAVVGGGTPSKREPAYWGGGEVDWYTPSDLTRSKSRFAHGSVTRITDLGVKESAARRFPPGSVLMTSRATLGVLAIATSTATCNQGFIVIPPVAGVPPTFIYEWLKDQEGRLESIATGATFKEITKGAFKRFPFVMPSVDVMAAFQDVVSPIEDAVLTLEQATRAHTDTRDLLLPRLVTGRLDISDIDLGGLLAAQAA